MAQLPRELAALEESLGSVPSVHVVARNALELQLYEPHILSWPPQARSACTAQINTLVGERPMHIHLKKINERLKKNKRS